MDKPNTLAMYLDVSRNAVMTVDALKRFMTFLAKFGYNELMLYHEDTFEVEGEPEFGYMRGRYSVEELQTIVEFGETLGITVAPAINTLAHLDQLFQWSRYAKVRDCNNILLVDSEDTYALIDKIFATMRKCYKTNRIHLGLDEAHNMGFGRYKDIHHHIPSKEERYEMFFRHTAKVLEIAKKYGFTDPIMDSDMYFSIACGYYYTYNPNMITEDIVKLVPEGVAVNFWSYFENKEIYEAMLVNHERLNRRITFMGGAINWETLTPQNIRAIDYAEDQVSVLRNHPKVKDFYYAMFGDDGGEADYLASLPAIARFADLVNGIDDIKITKAKFKEATGIDFDDFCKLDLPACCVPGSEHQFSCYDKCQLYSDPFLGLQDILISEEENEPEYYRSVSCKLAKFTDNEEYGYLFKTGKTLCDFLAYKSVLGKHVREAYQANDIERLKEIEKDFTKAEKNLQRFINAYQEQWMKNKKPFGLEIHDIRMGGQLARLQHCHNRLNDYLEGKLDVIPELEEKLDPNVKVGNGESVMKTRRWHTIASTSRFL